MIDAGLFIAVLLLLLPVLYGVALFDYVLVFATNEGLVRRLARPLLLVAVGVTCSLLAFTIIQAHPL
jgi:hypothetical protein